MATQVNIALLQQDMKYLKEGIDDIRAEIRCLDSKYIRADVAIEKEREQNSRIDKLEKLVFGAVGLALVTLGKTILELVVQVRAR